MSFKKHRAKAGVQGITFTVTGLPDPKKGQQLVVRTRCRRTESRKS
jgi:hypothetical protein